METDGAIDAEAGIQQHLRQASDNKGDAGLDSGKNATLLASGGIDNHRATEATPLLFPRDGPGSESSRNGGDDYRGTGQNEWQGLADFDGLPWWKRPSVRSRTEILREPVY